MISRAPFSQLPQRCDRPAVAGNAENDGRLLPWQEAAGLEFIPDKQKNRHANEAPTGLTLGLFAMLFSGRRVRLTGNAGERLAAHQRQARSSVFDCQEKEIVLLFSKL